MHAHAQYSGAYHEDTQELNQLRALSVEKSTRESTEFDCTRQIKPEELLPRGLSDSSPSSEPALRKQSQPSIADWLSLTRVKHKLRPPSEHSGMRLPASRASMLAGR
jgi:hypothetical protein